MRSGRFFLYLLIFAFSASAADNDINWNNFRQKAESYYYSTISSDIQNFSCLFTTNTYIEFAKGLGDTAGTYPLKFVWTRAGKIYYVLQPSVLLTDSLHRKKTLEKIQQTKNQFYGFYLDWYNFLILSPFDGIPDTARVKFAGDTVRVSYENQGGGETALIQKLFLKSGRLIQVEIDSRNERVVNYPQYREEGEKWLCYGFDTQIIRNQQVTSGLSTRMELANISSYWMPTRVDIVVQTIDKPNEKYLSVIFLKDYQVNLALQELTPPPATEKKGD